MSFYADGQTVLLDYHLSHVESAADVVTLIDIVYFYWYDQRELARGARVLVKVQSASCSMLRARHETIHCFIVVGHARSC